MLKYLRSLGMAMHFTLAFLVGSKAIGAAQEAIDMAKIVLSDAKREDLSLPKAVFVDWDNTITNSWPFLHEVMDETVQAHGKQHLTLEEFRNLPNINMPQAEIIAGIFGEDRPDVTETYWRIYKQKGQERPLDIDPDAEALLRYLKENEIFVAVVSNQEQAVLENNVKKSGLAGYFNCIVGAIRGEPEHNKPMIGAIRRAVADSPLVRELEEKRHDDWWFCGDGDSDIKTALNSGCFPVWISNYAIRPIQFNNQHENQKGLRVDTLGALLNIFKSL
ncbi:MAG: family hydrolase [Alphaproteobacteria bacterium]|jgi:phosphoglycolate phosphatase-like HAD superfamily hydrolase|nr:family hydrolase [Alphaproteobacteria bacterium]